MPKKLLIEDDDDEEGENLEDLEDPEGDKEDSPGQQKSSVPLELCALAITNFFNHRS